MSKPEKKFALLETEFLLSVAEYEEALEELKIAAATLTAAAKGLLREQPADDVPVQFPD